MHICMWNYNCLQMRIPMCLYSYIHMYICTYYCVLCLHMLCESTTTSNYFANAHVKSATINCPHQRRTTQTAHHITATQLVNDNADGVQSIAADVAP